MRVNYFRFRISFEWVIKLPQYSTQLLNYTVKMWPREDEYTLIKNKIKFSSYTYKEIQSGAVAKSHMRKGFLIYEVLRKYFPIYEEAVSHIWLCNCSILNFPIYEENFILFFISAIADSERSALKVNLLHTWRENLTRRIDLYADQVFYGNFHNFSCHCCRKEIRIFSAFILAYKY